MRTRSAVLLLGLATVVPRLAALLHEREAILAAFTDKGDDFARTFLATGTYGFIPGYPSAYTQPLYGWFLIPLYWIFGRHWAVVGLAQIAVATATTLLVWQIGRRWLTPAIGLVAGFVVALHPYLVWHDVHMNREILDHFLAAATVYLTLHAAERFGWRRALPLGAVIGLGILGNVRLEGLPFLLGAYLLWRAGISRRTLLAVGAIFAGAALLVAPWVARNKASVGCWAVTTDARALWKANNVNTYDTLKAGGWIDHVPQPKSFPPTPQDVYERWQRTGVVQPYDECAQMTMFQSKVIDFWREHPGEKLRLVPLDAQWLWQPDVVETRGRPGAGSWLDTLRGSAEPAYMIPLYVLALAGLFLVPRFLAALAALLLAYQTAVAVLFVGETRYRVPWDFLLALLAGAALVAAIERVRERRRAGASDRAAEATR
ncbi:MAG TPA: glycosyltransferase family 39 protein [Gaiellaceae bacterium]|nr:glycosyltransferase family 39 protein [Gaiellaceae bacterium]